MQDNIYRPYIHRSIWDQLVKLEDYEIALLCVLRMLSIDRQVLVVPVPNIQQSLKLVNKDAHKTKTGFKASIKQGMDLLQQHKILTYKELDYAYAVEWSTKWFNNIRLPAAYANKEYKRNTWCLLACLIAHRNSKTGTSFPTYAQMLKVPGLSDKNMISRQIKLLVDTNVITLERSAAKQNRYGNNIYTLSEEYLMINQPKTKKPALTPNEKAEAFRKLASYIWEQWPAASRTSQRRDFQSLREALARGAKRKEIKAGVNAYLNYVNETGVPPQYVRGLSNFLNDDMHEADWKAKAAVRLGSSNQAQTRKPLSEEEKQYL